MLLLPPWPGRARVHSFRLAAEGVSSADGCFQTDLDGQNEASAQRRADTNEDAGQNKEVKGHRETTLPLGGGRGPDESPDWG